MEWRASILATPSFWSHIDTSFLKQRNLAGGLSYVRMSLQRARDHPLCFELQYPEYPEDLGVSRFLESTFEVLGPYTHRLHSVYLRFWVDDIEFQAFFAQWIENIVVGSVRNLVCWHDTFALGPYDFKPWESHEEYTRLSGIRTLRLSGMAFHWHSPAYHNLVELHLSFVSNADTPRLDQLLGILASSPELRILHLIKFFIRESDGRHLQKVNLKRLRVLDFHNFNEKCMNMLLPFLQVPQHNQLSLRITTPSKHLRPNARSFMAGANITRLFVAVEYCAVLYIHGLLAVVPNLNVLLLDFEHREANTVLEVIAPILGSLCPKLHTLYIHGGQVSKASVLHLAQVLSSIKKLRLINCNQGTFDPRFATLIKQYIPDVIVDNAASEDITIGWYNFMVRA